MLVQFATYSDDSYNTYEDIKIEDEFHQQWHYVYASYSHALH